MTEHTSPRISVIMVDGSFREYFHAIDFFGNQTLPPDEYELIWVEYTNRVQPELAEKIAQYPNFKIITLNREDVYHSSYCFNAGITASSGEVIVIPDADVVVEPDFLERVWAEHQTNNKLVMYLYRFNEDQSEHKPDWDLDHLRTVGRLTNPSNYGGCLTVRKKWLLAINGYEQHSTFESGLHGNGYDIYSRLKILGLHVMWHPEIRLYHPWHPITGISFPTYQIHHAISDYRGKKLEPLAFEGIDPAHNHPFPPNLMQHVEKLRERYAAELASLEPPQSTWQAIRSLIKRLLRNRSS
ncbi:MAG: glycosyltransferase [Anaerolineae bacterium]|nr:glycosyltransferase [Anaerolineae bacterium]